MKRLIDFEVITNETFYKGWHILEYIEKHKLSALDIEAIKATIMDSLVYKGLINPEEDYLNLEELTITNSPNDYKYTKTPNISGIPQYIKEQLRHKCIRQSAGLPVMLFIAKPPSKFARYCVYDPNYAVSSIFEDANFINCIYDSPTRPGVRLTEVRPFVEVEINSELYLVDTITNRIFKSSWFKETYNLEIKDQIRKKKFNRKQRKLYSEMTEEECRIGDSMFVYDMTLSLPAPEMAETKYEVEQAKKNYPEEIEKANVLEAEMAAYFTKNKKPLI